MKATLNNSGLLSLLLRGGALAVLLLWSGLSFAPVARVLYGDLSSAAVAIEVFFFAVGVVGVASLYATVLFLAAGPARRIFMPSGHRSFDLLGLYAAVWIVLYAVVT